MTCTTQEEVKTYYDLTEFSLKDVETAFEEIELVAYEEIKKLKIGNTSLIIKAISNGSSVGGAAWHIDYNSLSIIYGIDIFEQEISPIAFPIKTKYFEGANILISNGYINPIQSGVKLRKVYNYVNEEKLKSRLEDVLMDPNSLVLIPISSKSKIIHMLVLLENIFSRSSKL